MHFYKDNDTLSTGGVNLMGGGSFSEQHHSLCPHIFSAACASKTASWIFMSQWREILICVV